MRRRAAERLKANGAALDYESGSFFLREAPEIRVALKDLFVAEDGAVVGTGSTAHLKQAPAFAANVSDVEVDPETGKTTILRYTAFQEVRMAVNPARVEAQMQGGAAQGIGWALTEEYPYDDQANLRNASLLDYRQPTALDLPIIDTEIVEVPASDGPYGIRGVGEVSTVPPAATLANAIAHATGRRMSHIPRTPRARLSGARGAAGVGRTRPGRQVGRSPGRGRRRAPPAPDAAETYPCLWCACPHARPWQQ